jgi:DNA replicative helicase MCM subunit Mcm2 (Cdc46/Mcm family)
MKFFNFSKPLLKRFPDMKEPTHLLLVGRPGIGKTRFLKAIENYSPFALASGSTGRFHVSGI